MARKHSRLQTSTLVLLSGFSVCITLLLLLFVHNNGSRPKSKSNIYLRPSESVNIDNPLVRLEPNLSQNDKPKTENLLDESIMSLDQKDEKLVEYIEKNHLTPPSEEAYNLIKKSKPVGTFVASYFKNKTTGTFIEVGAYDGERGSHTLGLELLGWKGLLIECNPHLLSKLMSKNRKAWIANICLSVKDKADNVELFSSAEWPDSAQLGKQLNEAEMKRWGIDWMKNKTWDKFNVPAFPLYSILAATREFKEIDFLSLDVQGAEFGVLTNFPLEDFKIKLIMAEFDMLSKQNQTELKNLMESKGYDLLKNNGRDYFFGLKEGESNDNHLNASIMSLDQKDEKLVEYIEKNHLTPPSDKPYNLTNSISQGSSVASYFKNKKDGTFIEAGAYDGETVSNTLGLELLGWKGLLIECNPHLIPKLRSKNRKAWIADVCLSMTDKADSVEFFSPAEWPASAQLGKQLNEAEMKRWGIDWMKNKTWDKFNVPAFPLYSILAATREFKKIDFLSLDVQGAELGVLTNFPFEDFKITMIMAEANMFSKKQQTEFKIFMDSKGYDLLQDMGPDYLFALRN